MKKFTKRTFAVVLMFVMVLSVMPMGVLANPAADATVVSTGSFPDGGGVAGASWRLYSDGTLVVDSGFIEWDRRQNDYFGPWSGYRWTIRRIIFTGPITAGNSLSGLFSGLSRVTTIEGLGYFDTSNVTDMEWMFVTMNNLTSFDVSTWDTSNVRSMGWMFHGVSSLTSLDLSMWDTSNVEMMSWMFAFTLELTCLDVSTWDTSNVKWMTGMFSVVPKLVNLDISAWDTSSLKGTAFMFSGTNSLESIDLSTWDTSNVTERFAMFAGTYSLRKLALSETFCFDILENDWGNARLPNIPTNVEFTGYWQNTRTGMTFTSEQLMETFDGATMHGTWIWQTRQRNITVTFGATQYFLDGEAFTQQTMVYNGVAYLPAAYLARRLGLTARWDAETNTTMLTSMGNPPVSSDVAAPERGSPVTRNINAIFGATRYYLDGEAFTQDTLVYDGVAYLPAAYLARKLGLTARWDAATDTTTLSR